MSTDKTNLSIIILVHNNQSYLKRIIDYYEGCPVDLLIADSSATEYTSVNFTGNINYCYLPGYSLIEKIAAVAQKAATTFIALNGVDDLIVPEAAMTCMNFLKQNPSYTSAIGNCFYFNKSSITTNKITYLCHYRPPFDVRIDEENMFERLDHFFSSYRTVYTGVHYTSNIVESFGAAGNTVRNLFLNEYLPGIYAIIKGKHAELPLFYQVREYAPMSDGATEKNLDQIVNAPAYRAEYQYFAGIFAKEAVAITGIEEAIAFGQIDSILKKYAEFLGEVYYAPNKTLMNKIKSVIGFVPVLGRAVLRKMEEKKNKKIIGLLIRNENEQQQLKKIEAVLFHHSNTTA